MTKLFLLLTLILSTSTSFALDLDDARILGERAADIVSSMEAGMNLDCSLDTNGYNLRILRKDTASVTCVGVGETLSLKIKYLDNDGEKLKITIK